MGPAMHAQGLGTGSDGGSGRMSSSTLLREFFPTLTMMAVSLLVGYVCARTRLTTQVELQGLAKVIGLFCLPALLFKTLAETDLRAVEWRFVGGMGLAKAIVFLLAIGLTALGERRRGRLAAGRRWIEAGLRGIMATQSNDYAFGAPILAALYSQSHPEFLPLIYLLAPISLVILNPLAFVLCELGLLQEKADQPPQPQPPSAEPPPPRRSRPSPLVSDDDDDDENEGQNRPLATAAAAASSSSSSSLSANGEEEEDSDPSTGGNVTYWRGAPLVLFYGDGDRRTASRAGGGGDGTAAGTAAAKPPPLASSSVWSSVLRQVASNPVVVMTFLGLVTGAGLQGKGLPPVLAKLLQGWADLFPVGALFLMGANMHGAVSLADDRTYLFIVVLVLAGKLLLVPLLAYMLTSALGGNADLATLAFIIGAFPVAPTVSIYGLRYAAPASRASGPGGFVQATDQASLAAAVVLSTLAALPILLIAILALEIQEQHSDSASGGDTGGQALFDDAVYYIQITAAIPAAWATLCLALQAATTNHPHPNRRSVRNSSPHHPLPPRHYPILALAACCLGRAVVGAACHDAATGVGRFGFWYLLFDEGAQLATVWAAAGGARLVRGRKPHLLALAATTALAVVLAGVAAHMASKNSSSSTCTPIQSAALDGLLAPLSGVCALVALLALFVYPAWRERRGGQRPDRATLPSSGALEPLLEGGGAAGANQQQQQQQQQQQRRRRRPQQGAGPLPSRRLKLLVAFSALTMLLGCGRCLLRLTRHNDDPSSYLAFIDASLAALLAPVLCCLYALERDLRVYRVLRRGFRWVGRWCLGRGGWGAKRRGGEMVA